jgi:hypothetical protein
MTREEWLASIQWSPARQPNWDSAPWRYVEAGLCRPHRSRRLGRVADPRRAFLGYLGVQHYDPARWGYPGEARCQFFVSCFFRSRTLWMRTFPTLERALEELWQQYQRLPVG